MRVRDVMTTDVTTVAPDTDLRDVAALLVEKRISGVPVVEAGRVVGVVSEQRHSLQGTALGRICTAASSRG